MRAAGIILLFLVSPALAATLNVNATNLAPVYFNTNASDNVLNLTLNVSSGIMNLTTMNVTFNVSTGNFSSVELRNASNALVASTTTFNTTDNKTTLSITGAGIQLNASANQTFWIRILTSRNATRLLNFTVNITSSSEFRTNNSADNYTIQGGSVQSAGMQVQDVHANASVTPRFVDTNVTNQSFVYVVTVAGTDAVNKTVITFPSNHTLVNVDTITVGNSNSTEGVTNVTSPNQINITLTTAVTSRIIVYFRANTSANSSGSMAFNATIEGANLTSVATDVTGNNTNVTGRPLVNVTSVTATKNAAYLNGSDYWEFNFSIQMANLSGLSVTGYLLMKMDNWTNSAGINISLSNSTDNFASLRDNTTFNATGRANVTNTYGNSTAGVRRTNLAALGTFTVFVRMTVPSGTSVSTSWTTVYSLLFRTEPS